MTTVFGLKRIKGAIMKFAQPDDLELNAILQETVRQMNRLIESRDGGATII